uniref:Uncharacterized protein n=2 Tax=Spongospora subterranea TaxID=70186 RepID=A0A0H5QT07_9EUKA|eukprot:CRZ05095.1 hypothetical protein [Spongospora subterranea]
MELHVRHLLNDAVQRQDQEKLRLVLTGMVTNQRGTSRHLLMSPSLLVIAAESAAKLQLVDEAQQCLHQYCLGNPRTDQFFCRMLLVQAQIDHFRSNGMKGSDLVQNIITAIASIMKAVAIAQQNKSYLFLLYNCSLVYWDVARPLLRPSLRRHVIPSLQTITEALLKSPRDQFAKEWLFEFVYALSLCFDEAGDSASAAKFANEAINLAKDSDRSIGVRATRLAVHTSRSKNSVPTINLNVTGVKSIIALQSVMSGMVKSDQMASRLKEAVQQITQDIKMEPNSLDLDKLDVVAEIGRAAWKNGIKDLAETCVGQSLFCKSFAGPRRSWMLSELTNAEILIAEKESEARQVDRSARLAALHSIAQTIDGCFRLGHLDLIQDVCMFVWNISLPLLHDRHRSQILTCFRKCAEGLRRFDTGCTEMRALFHYELAQCEISSGDFAKAQIEIDRAHSLDCTLPIDAISPKFRDLVNVNDFLRPYERDIKAMQKRLTFVCGAENHDSLSIEDRAMSLIEQSKEIKDVSGKRAVLSRAMKEVKSLPEDMDSKANRRSAMLWSDLVVQCFKSGFQDMANDSAISLSNFKFSPITDQDCMIMQANAALIRVAIFQSRMQTEGISAKRIIIASAMGALKVGCALEQDWVVKKAIGSLWNAMAPNLTEHFRSQLGVVLMPEFVEALQTCHDALLRFNSGDLRMRLCIGSALARALEVSGNSGAAKQICVCFLEPIISVSESHDLLRIMERVSPNYTLAKPTSTNASDVEFAAIILLIERAHLQKSSSDARLNNLTLAKNALEKIATTSLRQDLVKLKLTLFSEIADIALSLKQPALAIAVCRSCSECGEMSPKELCVMARVECSAGESLATMASFDQLNSHVINMEAIQHFARAVDFSAQSHDEQFMTQSLSGFLKAASELQKVPDDEVQSLSRKLLDILVSLTRTNRDKFSPQLRAHLYMISLTDFFRRREWKSTLTLSETVLKTLPDPVSRPIWKIHLQCVGQLGLDVRAAIGAMKEPSNEFICQVYDSLARNLNDPAMQGSYFREAINSTVDGSINRVLRLAIYAQWMHDQGKFQPSQISQTVKASMDILQNRLVEDALTAPKKKATSLIEVLLAYMHSMLSAVSPEKSKIQHAIQASEYVGLAFTRSFSCIPGCNKSPWSPDIPDDLLARMADCSSEPNIFGKHTIRSKSVLSGLMRSLNFSCEILGAHGLHLMTLPVLRFVSYIASFVSAPFYHLSQIRLAKILSVLGFTVNANQIVKSLPTPSVLGLHDHNALQLCQSLIEIEKNHDAASIVEALINQHPCSSPVGVVALWCRIRIDIRNGRYDRARDDIKALTTNSVTLQPHQICFAVTTNAEYLLSSFKKDQAIQLLENAQQVLLAVPNPDRLASAIAIGRYAEQIVDDKAPVDMLSRFCSACSAHPFIALEISARSAMLTLHSDSSQLVKLHDCEAKLQTMITHPAISAHSHKSPSSPAQRMLSLVTAAIGSCYDRLSRPLPDISSSSDNDDFVRVENRDPSAIISYLASIEMDPSSTEPQRNFDPAIAAYRAASNTIDPPIRSQALVDLAYALIHKNAADLGLDHHQHNFWTASSTSTDDTIDAEIRISLNQAIESAGHNFDLLRKSLVGLALTTDRCDPGMCFMYVARSQHERVRSLAVALFHKLTPSNVQLLALQRRRRLSSVLNGALRDDIQAMDMFLIKTSPAWRRLWSDMPCQVEQLRKLVPADVIVMIITSDCDDSVFIGALETEAQSTIVMRMKVDDDLNEKQVLEAAMSQVTSKLFVKDRHIIICCDELWFTAPFQLLPCFEQAASVSVDFSLALVFSRMSAKRETKVPISSDTFMAVIPPLPDDPAKWHSRMTFLNMKIANPSISTAELQNELSSGASSCAVIAVNTQPWLSISPDADIMTLDSSRLSFLHLIDVDQGAFSYALQLSLAGIDAICCTKSGAGVGDACQAIWESIVKQEDTLGAIVKKSHTIYRETVLIGNPNVII